VAQDFAWVAVEGDFVKAKVIAGLHLQHEFGAAVPREQVVLLAGELDLDLELDAADVLHSIEQNFLL
jgi:hypothetical protein